jgi:hypothetical protein
VPEPGACDFCLTLATRGAVYKSKMTAAGQKYHTRCHCDAKVEGDYDRRADVAIPPQDANRIITMRTERGRYEYTYDLSAGGLRIPNPPKMPRPAAVQAPTGPAAVDLVAGAVTQARLASVRLQLAQLRERLPTATDAARPFITGRIDELSAEEITLSVALG